MNRPLTRDFFLYLLAAVSSFFFFRTYAQALTTSSFLTADEWNAATIIITPILLLIIALTSLTFAMLLARRPLFLLLIPIAFIASTRLTVTSLISAAIILAAFVTYYITFFQCAALFKQPTALKAAAATIGLGLTILSIGIAFNFYQGYYLNATRGAGIGINTALTHKFSAAIVAFELDGQSIKPTDTLASYATRVAQEKYGTATPSQISAEEGSINGELDASAKPSASMSQLLRTYIDTQIRTTLSQYRKQLKILVPLAFFFITEVFSSIASYGSLALIGVIEFLMQRRGVVLFES